MLYLRSFLFNFCFVFWTTLICTGGLITLILPKIAVRLLSKLWSRGVMVLLKYLVGVDFVITGFEDILKNQPAFIISSHQSALETALFCHLIPDPVFILKRQLFMIPFFGWLLKRLGNVGVRKARADLASSLTQAVERAFGRKEQVVIFPEGSRTAPGERRKFRKGVGMLHEAFPHVPLYTVALNTGIVWPRRSFLKYPGRCQLTAFPPLMGPQDKAKIVATLQEKLHAESGKLCQNQNTSLT